MNKHQIINGIKTTFPQFRDKSTIVEYYCNYEVPQKQTNLLKLWTDVLKFVNTFSGTLVLSQQELLQIFQIYGLKPLPIRNVLKAMAQDKKVFSVTDLQKLYGTKNSQKGSQSGLLGKVWGYFSSPPKQVIELGDRVFFKELVDKKLVESSMCLRKIFKDTLIYEEQYVVERLKHLLKLNGDSEIIIDILQIQKRVKRLQISTESRVYNVVIYPGDGKEANQQTIQIQKNRFGLKIKLGEVNRKIQELYLQVQALSAKAKECLERGDRNLSLNFLRDKVIQQKFLAALINRRQLLKNTLNQLDESQMNQSLVQTITTSQQLIKSNLVDEDVMTQMKMNAQQIQFNLQQAQKIYKEVAGDNAEEEELYKKLEMEILEQKQSPYMDNPIPKYQIGQKQMDYNNYPTSNITTKKMQLQ